MYGDGAFAQWRGAGNARMEAGRASGLLHSTAAQGLQCCAQFPGSQGGERVAGWPPLRSLNGVMSSFPVLRYFAA